MIKKAYYILHKPPLSDENQHLQRGFYIQTFIGKSPSRLSSQS